MKDTNWFNLVKEKYYQGITNLFILYGNIYDYAIEGVPFVDYLVGKLDSLKIDEIAVYDIEKGLNYYKAAENRESKNIDDWNKMLRDIKSKSINKAFIIKYPDFIIPNIPISNMSEDNKSKIISLHKTINSLEFLDSENIVFIVADSDKDINDRFINSNTRAFPISIGYPNKEERLDMIKYLELTSDKTIKWEIDKHKLSSLTSGLSRMHIEDIYLQAEATGVMSIKDVVNRKNELLIKEYGDVIEILDSEGYSFKDFAGQTQIKNYHEEVIINPMLEGDTSFIPKGVLYSGPPGTGKSHFARCLAGEINATSVILKINKIMDKWVGESEKRLAKLFMGLEALSPVIVFVDEIDQAFGRGENEGNSVSKNIFGMFLQFLSEPSHRGKIIWIGATNYPNKMDEALKRTGRFDKKIPFLPPNKNERIEVFKIYLSKTGYPINLTTQNYQELADMTDKYTPAEIEGIIIKTLEIVKRKKLKTIDFGTVKYSIECIITTQNSKIDEMIEIALKECNDREFLPDEYK